MKEGNLHFSLSQGNDFHLRIVLPKDLQLRKARWGSVCLDTYVRARLAREAMTLLAAVSPEVLFSTVPRFPAHSGSSKALCLRESLHCDFSQHPLLLFVFIESSNNSCVHLPNKFCFKGQQKWLEDSPLPHLPATHWYLLPTHNLVICEDPFSCLGLGVQSKTDVGGNSSSEARAGDVRVATNLSSLFSVRELGEGQQNRLWGEAQDYMMVHR